MWTNLDNHRIFLFYLLLITSSSQLIKRNDRMLAQLIDYADYSTKGNWSYIIYDVDMKCYDSNPDPSKYDQSGNLLLKNSQQIYLASKEKVWTCDPACIGCFGLTKLNCVECASFTNPPVADIVVKKICTLGSQHFKFADEKNQVILLILMILSIAQVIYFCKEDCPTYSRHVVLIQGIIQQMQQQMQQLVDQELEDQQKQIENKLTILDITIINLLQSNIGQ